MESRWKNSALGPSERPLPANPFTELSPSQAPLPDLKAELTEIAQHVSSGITFFFFFKLESLCHLLAIFSATREAFTWCKCL